MTRRRASWGRRPHYFQITAKDRAPDLPSYPTDPEWVTRRQAVHPGPAFADPWSSSSEVLAPESWIAGLRFVHCFIGQWNPDDTGPIPVSVSVRG